MKKALRRSGANVLFGSRIGLSGDLTGLRGLCTLLYGDGSGLWGDCTHLSGDCTGVWGDCTGVVGSLNDCRLTQLDRELGVHITELLVVSKDSPEALEEYASLAGDPSCSEINGDCEHLKEDQNSCTNCYAPTLRSGWPVLFRWNGVE